ncbi:hypothetical protein JCM8208_005908 [Rhodotorula glutinis]
MSSAPSADAPAQQQHRQQPPRLHLSPQQQSPVRDANRSRSVGRSQSLNHAAGAGAAGQGTAQQGYAHDGALGALDEAAPMSSTGAGLVRSSNTVSATSRLVRLERNRARLALQGVGLSEEDQEFYVPPSPVRGGPYAAWSDIGHGGIPVADPSTSHQPHPASTSFAGPHVQAAWNRVAEQEQEQGGQQQQQEQEQSESPSASSAGTAQGFVPPEPKRSSFVVVRGGKGDQALTERRPHQPQPSLSSPPIAPAAAPSPPLQPSPDGQDQPLRHKNSLKPFLEQEREQLGGQEVEEDWERGLMDERKSGADGPGLGSDDDPYNHRTPPLSSSFSSQLSSPFAGSRQPSSAATSYNSQQPRRQVTADPWLPPSSASAIPSIANPTENASLVRRHQSLHTYQRGGRQREASIEQTLSSSPASASGWVDPSVAAADDPHHPRALGSLALANASTIAGFGTRTRAGTSPAPLALQHSHSLGHGPSGGSSAQSASVGNGGGARLSHSNSLGSRSDASGAGGAGPARVLSPVVSGLGGAPSPWSPTEEETKQLGRGTAYGSSPAAGGAGGSGSLSRGGSTSSRGSHSHAADYSSESAPPVPSAGAALADEVRRLDDALGAMQLNAYGAAAFERKSPSPNALPAPQPQHPPQQQQGARRLPPLMTSSDALGAPLGLGFGARQGPLSAAAFVPPIGHSHLANPHALDGISEYAPPAQLGQHHFLLQQQHQQQSQPPQGGLGPAFGSLEAPHARGNLTAVPGASSMDWSRQKEFLVGGATPAAANVALPFVPSGSVPGPFAAGAASSLDGPPGANGWPSPAALQQMHQQQQQIHVLQSQMAQALSAMDAMRAQGAVVPPSFDLAGSSLGPQGSAQAQQHGQQQQQQLGLDAQDAPAETPIDVNSLVAKKGYNPPVFDLKPHNARFFVIKSYTEEDVHKSLKYEIWASTDLGNKRLDRAFRESADKGPIYLFFSVNASGHFAGMAQMLTPVDYSMSSNVWASDKWKGVLKVRWIYIKDVPLSALRHIRLNNTPENKPVTSSRDTQEVPYDAGLEVLRIIAGYQSRTSLLQDYAWYEAQFRRQQAAGVDGDGAAAAVAQVPIQQIPPHYAPAASQSVSGSPQQPAGGGTGGGDKGPRQQQGGRRFWGRGGQGGAQVPPPQLQAHQQQHVLSQGQMMSPPQQNGMARGPPPHLAQAQGYYGGAGAGGGY